MKMGKQNGIGRTAAMTAALVALLGTMLTGCGSQGPEPETKAAGTKSAENSAFKEQDSTGKGAASGEQGNTDAAAGENVSYASMKEIKQSVIGILGENYWPDKQLTKEELEVETGIQEEMYEEYLAEKMNTETDIDRMILLLVKDEYLTQVENLLNEYRDNLMVKYKDRPQELGKAEASRIEIIDHYVCFVQLGADTSAVAKDKEEQILALCQQENERAIDVIEKTILE